MRFLKDLLPWRTKKKPTTDFSAFFLRASASERKKRIKEAVRKANQDQQLILKEYDRLFPRSV